MLILGSTGAFAAYPPLVFLAATLVTSTLEYITSWALEQLFGIRWWDYSKRRFNIHGRICARNSLMFGALGLVVTYGVQPLVRGLVGRIGPDAQRMLSSLIVAGLLVDLAFTLNELLKLGDRLRAFETEVRGWSADAQARLNARIEAGEERFRHLRSYPTMRISTQARAKFQRPGLYKLFWVFVTAGVIGFVLETVYCYIASGQLTSRQGLLYGPFNQVYGFGAVLMVLALGKLSEKNDRWLFLGSALIGGAFEYTCSFVQEKALGSVSWEYSEQTMSIGGRTSLMYMLFWGILGVVFIRDIYPRMSRMIDRIPRRQGSFFTAILAVLLIYDLLISGAAVYRWSKREQGNPPANALERYLDQQYPDDAMADVYPSMVWK